MDNMQEILVSICCTTYNQKDYIEKAIHSFLEQKTNFRYEILIHDDCSTDGTTEIVKEYEEKYPDLIRVLYEEENQYSKSVKISATLVWPKAKGKYIACCEGDDYWCDEFKLQRQVEYMENHDDCTLCLTNGYLLKNNQLSKYENNASDRDYDFTTYFTENSYNFLTASLLFRSKDVKELPKHFMNAPVGDVPLHLHLLLKGYAHLISDHSVVYRVGAKNSWTKVARKKKSNSIHIRMLNYWKGLDAYTEYKYHDLLKFKIKQKEFFIDIEQNPRSFFKKEYKKYRKWLGKKQIIYYIFRALLKAGDA